MSYNFSFIMDQIAGHVTFYQNLRSVVDSEPGITATWNEIYFYKPEGNLEQIHRKIMPYVPTYFRGIARGGWEIHNALKDYQRYDALFVNSSICGLFSHVFNKIPTVLDYDATPIQLDNLEGYGSGKPDPKPVAALKYKLFKNAVDAAVSIHVWSNWVKQSLMGDYKVPAEKIVINPPGVNLNFWKPDPTHVHLDKTPLRVLFVGGDFRRKGGLQLLEWYKSQSPEEFELHIVTKEIIDPQPGVYVYKDMEPNTTELLKLFQTCDIFTLPSLGECFGMATVEAMATGLPVIVSDVGGTADIVEQGRNGFIIPAKDISAMTAAFDVMLKDENRRLSMAKQSRILAEQRFDLIKQSRRTVDLIKQVARISPVACLV